MNILRFILMGLLAGSCTAHAEAFPLGEVAPVVSLTDQRYETQSLEHYDSKKAWVLLFLSNTCPLAQRYTSRIRSLELEYRERGVQFIGINASPADTIVDFAWYQQEHELPFPMWSDMDGSACKALGITRTPEALILDQKGVLRYRGRIDDQYRLGGVRPVIGRKDLVEALEDVLAGREVRVPKTRAEGCSITYPPLPQADETPTYHGDIKYIIQHRCLGCHEDNSKLPALDSFEVLKNQQRDLQRVLVNGQMPPWPLHSEFGEFIHTRQLSWKDKNTLLQWFKAGLPEGELQPIPSHIPGPGTAARYYEVPTLSEYPVWKIEKPVVLLYFNKIPPNATMECQLIRDDQIEETLFSIPLASSHTPKYLQFKSPPALQVGDSLRIITDAPERFRTMEAYFDKP